MIRKDPHAAQVDLNGALGIALDLHRGSHEVLQCSHGYVLPQGVDCDRTG